MTLYLQMTLYQQMKLYQQMTRISRRIKTYLKGLTGQMDFIKKGN